MYEDRRRSKRQKAFLRGSVYISRERGALGCVIRNISDDGARIVFSENVTLPDVFELDIPQRQQTMRARVQWRRNDEIGLTLEPIGREIGAPAPASAPMAGAAAAPPTEAGLHERIAMLEAELAMLRAQLAGIKSEEIGADAEAAA
jgi:hypothetical protein